MFLDFGDKRSALKVNETVTIDRTEYVIDREAGRGGIAITYIAHKKDDPAHWVALKELFPRALENAVAKRDEDGRVVIKPYRSNKASADEADKLLEESKSFFNHEAEMARAAGKLYDKNGNEIKQNSRDVFGVRGPFIATNQNCYLVIDTYVGESLHDFIEKGWQRKKDKSIRPNLHLNDILDILKKVSIRLSKLNGDSRMYHLDLSTSNIYISKNLGGTEFDPFIIDYGSAYCYDSKARSSTVMHRFTQNPFSAPEIQSLSQLQDEDCGYSPDASSDTYSIANILFYAAMGKIFSAEMRLSANWKSHLAALYPEQMYGEFANALTDFFEKGLAARQSERFLSADELRDALDDLSRLFSEGGLLSAMDKDDKMSYLILNKHPLYEYATKDALNVLCLGSGSFVSRMVLAIMSTGQMLNKKLRVHVVSQNAENFKSELKKSAPELVKYSNLNPLYDEKYNYIEFDFQDEDFAFGDENKLYSTCEEIAIEHCDFRYVIISLGSNKRNVDLARHYAKALGIAWDCDTKGNTKENTKGKAIIHYYMGEDAADNTRSDVSTEGIKKNISLVSFSELEYADEEKALTERAFRLHYVYEKQRDLAVSRKKALESFIKNEYAQKSSAASAVHLKYKLASIGVVPKKTGSEKSKAIKAYLDALKTKKDQLIALEHRRWLMYTVAEGYRCPSVEEIKKYCFSDVDGKFNASFKCTAKKLHHCLVPSDGVLRLSSLDIKKWDELTDAEIKRGGYDPLDMVSLQVHKIAKVKSLTSYQQVKKICDELSYNIVASSEECSKAINAFFTWFSSARTAGNKNGLALLDKKLSSISAAFKEVGVDISEQIEDIKKAAAVTVEYLRYVDYKKPDEYIVDHLLWLYYAREDIGLIKFVSGKKIDNIAPILLIEPKNVIYLPTDTEADTFIEFFENRQSSVKITTFSKSEPQDIAKHREKLIRAINQLGKNTAVIDVTGANEWQIAAAIEVSADNDVPVIFCDSAKQTVQSIRGFEDASIYTLKNYISSNEAYQLFGALPTAENDDDLPLIPHYIDKLWNLYEKISGSDQNNWVDLCNFMNKLTPSSEIYLNGLTKTGGEDQEYKREFSLDWGIFMQSKLTPVLESLRQKELITSYDFDEIGDQMWITVKYPNYTQSDTFRSCLSSLFKHIDKISTWTNKSTKDRLHFSSEKRWKYTDIQKNLYSIVDKDMRSSELITEVNNDLKRISFASPVIKKCLNKYGNILECYVLCKANETGYFDTATVNFTFNWSKNSQVNNELDVVMTKGLASFMVSCKTGPLEKEHLYEIKTLTDHFSVNSTPVIVNSCTKPIQDAVAKRAAELGIHIIGRNELKDLAQVLLKIARGERKPKDNVKSAQ